MSDRMAARAVLALGLGGLLLAILGVPWIYVGIICWILAVVIWIFL